MKIIDAVSNEWEFAQEIAHRAGVSTRSIGSRLGALERQGLVETRQHKKSNLLGDFILQYRKTQNEDH